MVNKIYIFNPKTPSFGSLSNMFYHPMMIEGKEWKSVTNFIFSNIITGEMNKIVLANSPPSKVEQTFQQLTEKVIFNIIRNNAHKAYLIEFKNNQKLAELLISTGDSPIYYMANDRYLGIGAPGASPHGPSGPGEDKKGLNIIGKVLMQIRHVIKYDIKERIKQRLIQKMNKKIYNIYLAYKVLVQVILKDHNNLKEYVNLTPDEIVQKYKVENTTAKWDKLAAKDKERYKKAMKRKREEDEEEKEKIKPPKSAYSYFYKETRQLIKEANPNMTSINITTELEKRWREANKKLNTFDLDTIISLYNRGLLSYVQLELQALRATGPEGQKPGILVKIVRKKYLKTLRENRLQEQKNVIFNTYIDSIIKKNYKIKESKIAFARQQQLSRLDLLDAKEREQQFPPFIKVSRLWVWYRKHHIISQRGRWV